MFIYIIVSWGVSKHTFSLSQKHSRFVEDNVIHEVESVLDFGASAVFKGVGGGLAGSGQACQDDGPNPGAIVDLLPQERDFELVPLQRQLQQFPVRVGGEVGVNVHAQVFEGIIGIPESRCQRGSLPVPQQTKGRELHPFQSGIDLENPRQGGGCLVGYALPSPRRRRTLVMLILFVTITTIVVAAVTIVVVVVVVIVVVVIARVGDTLVGVVFGKIQCLQNRVGGKGRDNESTGVVVQFVVTEIQIRQGGVIIAENLGHEWSNLTTNLVLAQRQFP